MVVKFVNSVLLIINNNNNFQRDNFLYFRQISRAQNMPNSMLDCSMRIAYCYRTVMANGERLDKWWPGPSLFKTTDKYRNIVAMQANQNLQLLLAFIPLHFTNAPFIFHLFSHLSMNGNRQSAIGATNKYMNFYYACAYKPIANTSNNQIDKNK